MQKIVLNKGAFAAILKNNNEIVVWGNNAKGGSIIPPDNDTKWWNPADIRRPKPETLVATDFAFAFIRDVRKINCGINFNSHHFCLKYNQT